MQEKPEPCEDEPEVEPDGGEEGVGVVAGVALEEVSAEMAVSLHVSDHRFDGGSAPELALDDAVHAAFLA